MAAVAIIISVAIIICKSFIIETPYEPSFFNKHALVWVLNVT
jgi:hypothetical protein